MLNELRKTWATRLQFGILLLFFGEILAWQHATNHTPLDWFALILIYVSLASLLLDFIARLKIDSLPTVFLLAGFYGVMQTLLLAVLDTTWDNFPIQLILLPFGVQVLAFLLAYGSFRLFSSGEATGLFAFLISASTAFIWGTWVRWSPDLEGVNYSLVEFNTSLLYLTVGFILSGLAPLVLRSSNDMVNFDWMLTPYEGAVVGGVLFVTLVLRSSDGYLDNLGGGTLALIGALITFSLYFTRNLRRVDPFRTITPPKPPLLVGWFVLIVPFIPLAWLGYHLAEGDSNTPFYANLVISGIFIFAVLWLPLASIRIGIQIFTSSIREGY